MKTCPGKWVPGLGRRKEEKRNPSSEKESESLEGERTKSKTENTETQTAATKVFSVKKSGTDRHTFLISKSFQDGSSNNHTQTHQMNGYHMLAQGCGLPVTSLYDTNHDTEATERYISQHNSYLNNVHVHKQIPKSCSLK